MTHRVKPRGSILIVALWSVLMLSILAVSLGAGVRQRLVLTNRLETADRLAGIAFAGIEAARSIVRRPDLTEITDSLNEEWASAEALANQRIEQATFSVLLEDEERKIDLNKAAPETLSRLLVAVGGMDEEKALETAYCIADWRDADFGFQHPEFGAEDDDYDDSSFPYGSKDAPFEALDELLLVKGVSREVFDKIRPFITFKGSGVVNANTAPAEVFVALGAPPALAQKITAYRAGPDLLAGTPDDLVFFDPATIAENLGKAGVEVDSTDQAVLADWATKGLVGVASQYFTARSRGRLDSTGAAREAEAVMDRKGRIYYYRMYGVSRP